MTYDPMAASMEVSYPWPHKNLSPNAREHWSTVAKHKTEYRMTCYLLTLAAGLRSIPWDGEIHLWVDIFPPDRRARDQDNIISSCKALFDGMADALNVNDRRFRIHQNLQDQIGGIIRVRITAAPGGAISKPVGTSHEPD